MAGYWSGGRFVAGTTLRTAGNGGVSALDLEIAAAVARVCEHGGALEELGRLLERYPLLRGEPAEEQEHPLTGLACLYAIEQLNGTGSFCLCPYNYCFDVGTIA